MLKKRELELIESIEKRLVGHANNPAETDYDTGFVMKVEQIRSLISIIDRLDQQLIEVQEMLGVAKD